MRFLIFKDKLFFKLLIPVFVFLIPLSSNGQYLVFDGTLRKGFNIGVDSHFGNRDWMVQEGVAMKMSYPGNQAWGAVYITVGTPYPDANKDRRKTVDLSAYSMLSVELKGNKGGERVWIGLKDKDDPSNGSETKKELTLSSNWSTYNILLKDLRTADLKKIHVPVEIIFGQERSTIFFRNVMFYK